jgi:hypothetical protein
MLIRKNVTRRFYNRLVIQLILSYMSYNIGKRGVVDLSHKLLGGINFKDEELITVLSGCGTERDSEKKLKILTYITLMCENGVNEFKQILNNRKLKESFIDYFVYITHNVGDFLKTEGSIIAVIRLITYTHIIKLNEQRVDQRTEMINKIIAAALNFYDNKNSTYVVYLIQAFKAYFEAINSSADYIWYLQNIYLRSFEFYEVYTNKLDSVGTVPERSLEEALLLIVQLTTEYFGKDEDNDIKVSSIRKMINLVMAIILNPKTFGYEWLKPFWQLLHKVIHKDLYNVVCTNDDVINVIINTLNETIEKYPDDMKLREIYKLLASRLENNLDLFEKIIAFIGSDLLKDNMGRQSDVKILSDLSVFPITPKLLIKSHDGELLKKLISLYSNVGKEDIDMRKDLSNIFKNLLANGINIEEIVNNFIEAVKAVRMNLFNKVDEKTETGLEIISNEIDSLVSLINEGGATVETLITDDDIQKIVEMYKHIESIQPKLQSLEDKLARKSNLDSLQKDKEAVQSITEFVRNAFEDHMNELESLKTAEPELLPETLQTVMTTSSGIGGVSRNKRLSVITKVILFNPNNVRFKSPISSKDNSEVVGRIEQILQLIRKLHNDNKAEVDSGLSTERNNMIEVLLSNLKALSVSPDNHKSILELGLLHFMEKYVGDPTKILKIYGQCIDVAKNCTYSENAIPSFLTSCIADQIVNEVLWVYTKPELLQDQDVMQIFVNSNQVFSSLCRSKKGFAYLSHKLNEQKLLEIATKTLNMDILAAILEMFTNYVQKTEELANELFNELLGLLIKCFNLTHKTRKLMVNALILAGMLYREHHKDQMAKLDLIKVTTNEFDKHHNNEEFLNAVLFCLGKVTNHNVKNSRDLIDTGLLGKLVNASKDMITTPSIAENISSLYNSLVRNNLENIEKCIKAGVVNNIFFIINSYLDKPNPEIMLNCISSLDSMTISDTAIIYLAEGGKFVSTIYDVVEKRQNDLDVVKIALHSLGSFIYKDLGVNVRSIEVDRVVVFLINLQKTFYSNSDILININYIAGYLVKMIKDKEHREKVYLIISDSVKIQDWNVPLIVMALKLMTEILSGNTTLQDDVFENNLHCLLNLLKQHKENMEIQIAVYKLLALFAKNTVNSNSMIAAGVTDLVKSNLEAEFKDKKSPQVVYNLLALLSKDPVNALKVSNTLMDNLIKALKEENPSDVLKLLSVLVRSKNCIEPFIQYNGLELVINILKANANDINTVLTCFAILYDVTDSSEDYRKMAYDFGLVDLVNEIIQKIGYLDKKIEFEGRTLIFTINSMTGGKLEELDDIGYSDIRLENPIKSDVRNFLTDGKVVKM